MIPLEEYDMWMEMKRLYVVQEGGGCSGGM